MQDLNEHHTAEEYAKTRVEFESDLYQNLELWLVEIISGFVIFRIKFYLEIMI